MTTHPDPLAPWRRDHSYLGTGHERNAGRTRVVMALTALVMVAEIAAGAAFGSIALLADGLHVAGHVAVLGAAASAYAYARRHAAADRYSFGTGKVGDLVAFASAIVLGVIAVVILYESAHRLIAPETIVFREALIVAALGFVVNLLCVGLLWDRELHEQVHGGHHHEHDHADHNVLAAYLHLLTDVLTSVLAIIALAVGTISRLGLDGPADGDRGRARHHSLGVEPPAAHGQRLAGRDARRRPTPCAARWKAMPTTEIADLHVWRVGPGHLAAMLTVVTNEPRPPAHYKTLLAAIPGLSHVTVEVETRPAVSAVRDELPDRHVHAARHA